MMLAVTGLEREARILAQPGIMIVTGGGDGKTLEARMKLALEAGARHILSIGICGAISPVLRVGDCVVASAIVFGGESFPTHIGWRNELLAQVPRARAAVLAGSDRIVADPEDRAQLHLATNAVAVDMESHIAARVARLHGLPFATFRVVSDSYRQSLPPAARVAMAASGKIDFPAVLRSIASVPNQIPALIRTAWDAERAFRELLRYRHVCNPAFSPIEQA